MVDLGTKVIPPILVTSRNIQKTHYIDITCTIAYINFCISIFTLYKIWQPILSGIAPTTFPALSIMHLFIVPFKNTIKYIHSYSYVLDFDDSKPTAHNFWSTGARM